MAKEKNRRRQVSTEPSPFEQARDELFQHVMRCDVIGADPQHQTEWFNDTLGYLAERYHELSAPQIAELRTLGERFCQPPKAKAPQTESEPETADAVSAA